VRGPDPVVTKTASVVQCQGAGHHPDDCRPCRGCDGRRSMIWGSILTRRQ
jgi:hypothetical protein